MSNYNGPVSWGAEYTDCISAEGQDSANECPVAQSAEAQNTDCISAEGKDSPNECPVAQSAGAVKYTDCITVEE